MICVNALRSVATKSGWHRVARDCSACYVWLVATLKCTTGFAAACRSAVIGDRWPFVKFSSKAYAHESFHRGHGQTNQQEPKVGRLPQSNVLGKENVMQPVNLRGCIYRDRLRVKETPAQSMTIHTSRAYAGAAHGRDPVMKGAAVSTAYCKRGRGGRSRRTICAHL